MAMIKPRLKTTRIKNLLAQIQQDLPHQQFEVEKIILFGSCAKNTLHPTSDLDICIVSEQEPPLKIKRQIENYFKSYLDEENMDLDTIYCNRTRLMSGIGVYEKIREEGVLIYENLLGNC